MTKELGAALRSGRIGMDQEGEGQGYIYISASLNTKNDGRRKLLFNGDRISV